MTPNELREAVAREVRDAVFWSAHAPQVDDKGAADRIICMVVERCAREARKAGTYERRVWDGRCREYDEVTEEVAGLGKIVDAISALAPKEPAP